VDFTALAEAGSHAGCEIAGYWSQAQFLIGAGLPEAFAFEQAAATDDLARQQVAQQVKRLMLPEAMGERFQAMLMTRQMTDLPLPAGLFETDQRRRL
jgi:SAM-dependent MidA family methyltransferase